MRRFLLATLAIALALPVAAADTALYAVKSGGGDDVRAGGS